MEKVTATPEQIAEWKKKHGDIFKITVDGKTAFLKKPDRNTLAYVSSIGSSNPIKANEALLKSCWIEGDEEIKTNDDLFLGASAKLSELIQIKEAELEKL